MYIRWCLVPKNPRLPWNSFPPTPSRPVLSASRQPCLHDSRRPAGLPKPSRPLRNDQRWQISLRKCRENWNLTCEIGNSKLILTTNTPLISESRWIPTPSILENSPTCCFLEFSPNNPFKIIHYSGSKPRRPGYPFHHLQRSFLAEVPPSSIQTSQQSLRIGRLQGFGSRAAEDTWGTGPHRGQQDLPEGWKGQNCCGKVVLNLTINYLCFEENLSVWMLVLYNIVHIFIL